MLAISQSVSRPTPESCDDQPPAGGSSQGCRGGGSSTSPGWLTEVKLARTGLQNGIGLRYRSRSSTEVVMSIRTEKVQIPVKGAERPMPGYVAVPEGAGPFPAVIVFEEIFGVNSHIRDVTERVAREGYLAIAPDYHHRVAPGLELPYDEQGMKKGMELIPKLTV